MLPSRFPNLLVNGSTGIAVGMATNMPPHHLGETIDAVVAMIDDPTIDVERPDAARQGPGLPDRRDHRRPRGHPRRLPHRPRPHRHARAARTSRSCAAARRAIVVTELPYGVKKGGDERRDQEDRRPRARQGAHRDLAIVADHSDRTGMRIQIELKRDAVPQVALNKLFKHTPLQTTFGYNAVALVDGVPQHALAARAGPHYLDFQREVVTRRSKFELRKAERRAHILEGYLIALDNIDAVIALIRAADDTEEARDAADGAVRLSRAPGERDPRDAARARSPGSSARRSRSEYDDLMERIGELREILGDEAKIDGAHPRGAARDQGRPTAAATTAAPRSSPPRRSSSSRT